MNKDRLLSYQRQQVLEFVGEDIWQRLSKSSHLDSQELISQILVQVIRHETEQGGEYERQDQP